MSRIRKEHLTCLEPEAFERFLSRYQGSYFRIYSRREKGYWSGRHRTYTTLATQGTVYYLSECVSLTNHLGAEAGIEFVPLTETTN